MPIDWDNIQRRVKGYTPAQIAAAVTAVKKLPGKKNDPNKIPTLWDRPKAMPTLADVDFGTVTIQSLEVNELLASNKNLKRDRLIWHVQHPGEALNPSVFTENPLVMESPDGNVIIDGHHRLAALKMLGASEAQVYNLPAT